MNLFVAQKMRSKTVLITFTLYCVSSLTFADNKSHELPLFTPFNWAESKTGYIVKGIGCTHISNLGNVGCAPVTIVVDTPHHRLLVDLGRLGGQYYMLEDISYINEAVPGSGCLQVPGFTFSSQVTGYQNLLSAQGSAYSKATYVGLAADVGSCKDKISASMTVQNGVLAEYDFAQFFPIQGLGYQYVTSMITLDPKTIDKTSDRSTYFMMPSTCNRSSANYCDTILPPVKS